MPNCKACGKPIMFAKHHETGKSIPLDAKPRKFVQVLPGNLAKIVSGYTTHFETCPFADRFRKKKGKGKNGN